jgi:hypothetical protein
VEFGWVKKLRKSLQACRFIGYSARLVFLFANKKNPILIDGNE